MSDCEQDRLPSLPQADDATRRERRAYELSLARPLHSSGRSIGVVCRMSNDDPPAPIVHRPDGIT